MPRDIMKIILRRRVHGRKEVCSLDVGRRRVNPEPEASASSEAQVDYEQRQKSIDQGKNG